MKIKILKYSLRQHLLSIVIKAFESAWVNMSLKSHTSTVYVLLLTPSSNKFW